jgi:hypothetical protein
MMTPNTQDLKSDHATVHIMTTLLEIDFRNQDIDTIAEKLHETHIQPLLDQIETMTEGNRCNNTR